MPFTSIIRCWAAFYKPLNLRDLQASPQPRRESHESNTGPVACTSIDCRPRCAAAKGRRRRVRPTSPFACFTELQDKIPPEDLQPTTTVHSIQCDVWSHYGVLLMLQRKVPQAIEIFDAL
jgi:hypothetical protein